MLLDTRTVDSAVVVGAGHDWQPTRAAAAGHRPAAGFLSLPALDAGIPVAAEYRRRGTASFNELVLAHFRFGPLRAADVNNPVDNGDAFQQAFFAWAARQLPPRKRIEFVPRLLDSNAVVDAIEHHYDRGEFEDTSPLYLAMEMDSESLYRFGGRVEQLKVRHPLLVYTMLSLIDIAGCRTVWVRTPGWYLQEFACYHWDGDLSSTDQEIREWRESNGEEADGEDAQRYLPSNVTPALFPDEFRKPERIPGRRRRSSMLSESELLALRKKCRGLPRTVCTELIQLTRLLQILGKRSPMSGGFNGNPVYASCSVVFDGTDLASEVIDDYFNNAMQGGDYSTYSSFIPLANNRVAIRRQYRDWVLAFQIIRHLDRLLALVTEPTFFGD
jgi:PRTRC genetic system protein F